MTNPYKKSVAHLDTIDVHKIADLYEINDNRQFHALKKILCAGKRGAKGKRQDMEEAKQSIQNWLDNDGVNIPPEVLKAAKQYDWANWVAQDGDGYWWVYQNKPAIYHESHYNCREFAAMDYLNIKTSPTNWRDSLTRI